MYDTSNQSNPGQQLQLFLKELYPLEDRDAKSFVRKIDDALMAEGDFISVSYESVINYMVRRLITMAEYLKRKHDPIIYPSEKSENYILEIRKYLRDFTRIPPSKTEKTLTLLLDCLKERDRELTQKTKDRIRRKTKTRSLNCYICGRPLNFEEENQHDSFEVEHIWPHTMGGLNDDFNLKGACCKCNRQKANYIESSDFHFEEICLVKDKKDPQFNQDFRSKYRVAILAKNKFQCSQCGKPAEHGELQFGRRETSDSWHYLNIDAYCSKHVPE